MLLVALALSVAAPPPFADVAPAVCAELGISANRCAAANFERPIAIDVDGDRRPEWIYVVASGGPPACFVRHACFAIVKRLDRRWNAVASGMASEIAVRKDGTLVTGGSNSASETQLTFYVWRRGRFRAVRSRACRTPCAALATSIAIQ